jgi:hypothetical protein
MWHADVKTTMRYLHYRDRADAAARLNAAFAADPERGDPERGDPERGDYANT